MTDLLSPGRVWLTRLMIVAMISLVVAPIVSTWLPGELPRWVMAASIEDQFDGQLDSAIARLDRAASRWPDHLELRTYRADLYIARAQHTLDQHPQSPAKAYPDLESALQQYQQMIDEWRPSEQPVDWLRLEQMHRQKSQVFHFMGRHRQAVKELVAIQKLRSRFQKSPAGEKVQLNQSDLINPLCYARGLAGTNLQSSIRQMDVILKSTGGPSNWRLMAASIFHWLEFDQEAIRYYDRALEEIRAEFPEVEAEFKQKVADHLAGDGGTGTSQLRQLQAQRNRARKNLAWIFARRGALRKRQGESELAKQDWQQVEQMGYQPEELAQEVYRLYDCEVELARAAAWLDTRGYLLYRSGERGRSGELKRARADLDLALELMEVRSQYLQQWFRSEAKSRYDIRNHQHLLRSFERNWAVMHYHRHLILKALDDESEAADRDLARVRSLGFEPGPHLF